MDLWITSIEAENGIFLTHFWHLQSVSQPENNSSFIALRGQRKRINKVARQKKMANFHMIFSAFPIQATQFMNTKSAMEKKLTHILCL